MEAVKFDGPVIVKVAYTDDIFVLMCYAHSHERKTSQQIMRIDSERFTSVNLIGNYCETRICNILPACYSITGCDATSYAANVGKTKSFKKIIKLGTEDPLADFSRSCCSKTVLNEIRYNKFPEISLSMKFL